MIRLGTMCSRHSVSGQINLWKNFVAPTSKSVITFLNMIFGFRWKRIIILERTKTSSRPFMSLMGINSECFRQSSHPRWRTWTQVTTTWLLKEGPRPSTRTKQIFLALHTTLETMKFASRIPTKWKRRNVTLSSSHQMKGSSLGSHSTSLRTSASTQLD